MANVFMTKMKLEMKKRESRLIPNHNESNKGIMNND